MGASVWPRCPCFFVRVTSDGGTAESCSATDASTLRTRKKRRKKDGEDASGKAASGEMEREE